MADHGSMLTVGIDLAAEAAGTAVAWVEWSPAGAHERDLRDSDHAFDAVVAALTARAAQLGLASRPGPEHAAVARSEGWIATPKAPLDRLSP